MWRTVLGLSKQNKKALTQWLGIVSGDAQKEDIVRRVSMELDDLLSVSNKDNTREEC